MAKPIPADRADIALQASWEIMDIAEIVHAHMSLDAENLAYRALLRRCKRPPNEGGTLKGCHEIRVQSK